MTAGHILLHLALEAGQRREYVGQGERADFSGTGVSLFIALTTVLLGFFTESILFVSCKDRSAMSFELWCGDKQSTSPLGETP